LSASYQFLWAGQRRSFLPAQDLIIYNEGTNDQEDIGGYYRNAYHDCKGT